MYGFIKDILNPDLILHVNVKYLFSRYAVFVWHRDNRPPPNKRFARIRFYFLNKKAKP